MFAYTWVNIEFSCEKIMLTIKLVQYIIFVIHSVVSILSCRVIQKAIRCLEQEDVDKVLTFIHDPNGNHVIQICIQVMSSFAKSAVNSDDPGLASSLSHQTRYCCER